MNCWSNLPFVGLKPSIFSCFSVFPLFPPCLFSMWGTQNYVRGMSRDVLAARWPEHFFRLKARILKAKKQVFRNFKHFKGLKSFFIHIELQETGGKKFRVICSLSAVKRADGGAKIHIPLFQIHENFRIFLTNLFLQCLG